MTKVPQGNPPKPQPGWFQNPNRKYYYIALFGAVWIITQIAHKVIAKQKTPPKGPKTPEYY